MISFVEEYMSDKSINNDECECDGQKIMLKAMSKVLPLIIKNELTDRQSLCLRLFYVHNKSQLEIAKELKLSQPTVSRHISTAKEIVKKYLNYCLYTVNSANEQWLKI